MAGDRASVFTVSISIFSPPLRLFTLTNGFILFLLFVLIVSKLIVDEHNGILSVYSPGEGLGSTFSLEMPVKCKLKPTNDSVRRIVSFDSETSQRSRVFAARYATSNSTPVTPAHFNVNAVNVAAPVRGMIQSTIY